MMSIQFKITTGSCHEPAPAVDGCSDEPYKGHSRNRFLPMLIEIAGSCFGKEVMAQMV